MNNFLNWFYFFGILDCNGALNGRVASGDIQRGRQDLLVIVSAYVFVEASPYKSTWYTGFIGFINP